MAMNCFAHRSVRGDSTKRDVAGIATADNLIYKAAKMLQPFNQTGTGVTIHLTKNRLWVASAAASDAATTLLALNQLWQCNLSLTDSAKLGLKLGADVPVFIAGKTAIAHGVGEQLEAAENTTAVVFGVAPAVHVSTAAVFTHPDLSQYA